MEKHVDEAITIGLKYDTIDGAHYKQWVITKMLRLLMGDEMFNRAFNSPKDVEEYGEWDEGIAP